MDLVPGRHRPALGSLSVFAGAFGQRPADQLPRPDRGPCDRRGNPDEQTRRQGRVVAVRCWPVPLLERRPLHVQLSQATGSRRRFSLDRRRALPLRVPRVDGRPAHPHQTAKPAPRPRRTDRCTDPDDRHRPALLGLPDCTERPSREPLAARERSVGRLPARRRPAARRRHSPCRRRRQALAGVLAPRQQHRLPAGDGLRLQLRAPERHLQPPADLRRRLDLLLPPLGRGCSASVHALPRGAGCGFADATDAAPAHPARRRVPDSPGDPACPVPRQPRLARSHRRLRGPLPTGRREDGRAGPAGGARGLARARSERSGRRARCRRRPRPGGNGGDLRRPSSAGSGAAGAPRAHRAEPGGRRGLIRRGHRWSRR